MIVGGARPNFMKIAPLIHELKRKSRGFGWKLVHTGQHYDYEMSKVFFDELDIKKPDYFLKTGGGTQSSQTAAIMTEFEKVFLKERPDITVVVGDVNSTLACSLVAKKFGGRIAHVEAGLRSGDLAMPEEINRIVTDSIADFLFVTEKDAVVNLLNEGKPKNRIFFVGNIMIDTLLYGLKKIKTRKMKWPRENDYAVATLHRPANVDDAKSLRKFLGVFREISEDMKVCFSVHPRTAKNIKKFGLSKMLSGSNVEILPPLSYLDFLALWKNAKLVLTDSGGIQEETTFLGIPCLTLRDNTERPITITQGTNVLAGTDAKKIMRAYRKSFSGKSKRKKSPPKFWDGRTAARILDILAREARV